MIITALLLGISRNYNGDGDGDGDGNENVQKARGLISTCVRHFCNDVCMDVAVVGS